MDADFQHFYHLDIRDFLTGKDHPARALRLITFLPEGGAFRSVLNAEPREKKRGRPQGWQRFYGWDNKAYIAAATYSAILAVGGADDTTYPDLPTGAHSRKGRPLIPND